MFCFCDKNLLGKFLKKNIKSVKSPLETDTLVFALVYALELRAKYNAVDRNLIFKNIEISDFSRKFLRIRSKFRDSEITQIDAQWPMA